jgi:hypothetical protein
MSHATSLRQRHFAGSLLSILCLVSAGLVADQNPFKKLIGGDKSTSYQTFKDPAGRFEIEYPTKDWRLLPSVGTNLAIFSRSDGPTLLVDLQKLEAALTPGELDRFPDVEVEILKDQQPKVKTFKTDKFDARAGRGVLIKYVRADKEPESVMQYSIPVGQDLYRLNGVVPERLLSKYESIIMHMIQSFKTSAESPAPKN